MIVPEPAPQDEVRGRRHRPGLVEREHREPTCGVPQVVRTILGQQSCLDGDPPRLVVGQRVRRLRGHVMTISRNADVVLGTPSQEVEQRTEGPRTLGPQADIVPVGDRSAGAADCSASHRPVGAADMSATGRPLSSPVPLRAAASSPVGRDPGVDRLQDRLSDAMPRDEAEQGAGFLHREVGGPPDVLDRLVGPLRIDAGGELRPRHKL
jgi:hypothetical protein